MCVGRRRPTEPRPSTAWFLRFARNRKAVSPAAGTSPVAAISSSTPSRDSLSKVLVATAAGIRAVRARRPAGDYVACRGQHVPGAAERTHTLSTGVADLPVAHEEVQRVAVIGHLPVVVGAVGGGHHRGLHSLADCRLAADSQRRPVAGAGAEAGALGALVLLEDVERAALGVDQDLPRPAGRNANGGGPSAGALWRRHRSGGAATVSAATAGDQRDQWHRQGGDQRD